MATLTKTKRAFCTTCGKASAVSRMALGVDVNLALHLKLKWGQWENEHREPEGSIVIIRSSDIPKWEPAPWRWTHMECEGGGYWIDGERIETEAQALSWTLHMMGKSWFGHTDWSETMERLFPGILNLS